MTKPSRAVNTRLRESRYCPECGERTLTATTAVDLAQKGPAPEPVLECSNAACRLYPTHRGRGAAYGTS